MTTTTVRPAKTGQSTVFVQGFALRVIRKRSGQTSGELAAAIGCDSSYIRLIETGHRTKVSEEFLAKLRHALDLDQEDRRVLLAWPHDEVA